jgi:ankyrin repeat protein
MIREHELDLHPLVEELNVNNEKIKDYIGSYTKIELRNMMIIGLKKGYKNFVEIYVNSIPNDMNFDFDIIVNVASKLGYLDLIQYLDVKNKIDLVKLKDLVLKKSSFHSNHHILEWMVEKNILEIEEILKYNARIGKIDIIKYFYDKGNDIHFRNEIVMRTAGYSNQLETVIELCENYGCDIYAQNDSVLKFAAESGYIDLVKYSIKSGSNVNVSKAEPIRKSCIYGHTEVVKFLVESGANYKVNSNEPFCKACANGHIGIIKYLLTLDIDINVNSSEPLRTSIKHKHQDIFNLLIDRGADIFTHANILLFTSIDNGKPLISAICQGYYEIVEFLIVSGASIEHVDNSLVSQTISKYPKIIQLLLDYNFDINILSSKTIQRLEAEGFIECDNLLSTNKIYPTYNYDDKVDDFNFDEYEINIS